MLIGTQFRQTEIISLEQSAFECLHFVKTNNAKKHHNCALQTGIIKADDRVDWDYLEAIMGKLGFGTVWISSVMICVRNVSFSVLFDCDHLEDFKPTCGIRQGGLSQLVFLC